MSRGRAARLIPVSPAEVTIPDKLYFRIGEVSELTRTKAFVLRYWETEFPSLRPRKGKWDTGFIAARMWNAELERKPVVASKVPALIGPVQSSP